MNRLLLIALVAVAASTRAAAQESVRPSAMRAAADASPRVRASHRVDVIAPGERIDTVIDRARGASAAMARGVTAAQTLPVRPAEKRAGTVTPPQDAAVRAGNPATAPTGSGTVPTWGGAAPGWGGNTGTWGAAPTWGTPPTWGSAPPGGYPRGDVPPMGPPPRR